VNSIARSSCCSEGRLAVVMMVIGVIALGIPCRTTQSETKPSGSEDAQAIASLEKDVLRVRDAVTPAVCATFYYQGPMNGQRAGTAVVISGDGQLLTHAHHLPGLRPGDQLGVAVGNGRKDLATVMGVDRVFDLSLLKLNGAGPWPKVNIGKSQHLKRADACIALGFPKPHFGDYEQPGQSTKPMLRLGQFLGANHQTLLTTCRTTGGDSGCPVFNMRGELVGITRGLLGNNDSLSMSTHVSTEIFLSIRGDLERGVLREIEPSVKPLAKLAVIPDAARTLPQSIVAIQSDGKDVCHGVVVDENGLILTKASELAGELQCRFWDGSVSAAKRLVTRREHDLALVKVERRDLPTIQWPEENAKTEPGIGAVMLTVTPQGPPVMGIVGSELAVLPHERGQLMLETSDPGDGRGIVVNNVSRRELDRFLKSGDRITRIEGAPTLTGDDFLSVREKLLNDPSWSVGDRLALQIKRDGQTLEVEVPIVSESGPAYRYRGFASVFAHDSPLSRKMAGTPIVDIQGAIVGLTIVASESWYPPFSYSLPIHIVKKQAMELRRLAMLDDT
jgi:S1-C subfamily serine protease